MSYRYSLLVAACVLALAPVSLFARPLPGQIIIDPQDTRWLKREGGAHLFICGPGGPEDFLYDGVRRPDGTRAGRQVELINTLVQHGGNCLYMQAVRTHGGDARNDKTHNPFIDSDPAKGVDPRILDQWEQWFRLMDANGILIYFFFYDDGARVWNTGEDVGPEERAFFETVVRRFQHHKNLIWVVGEESEEAYPHARVRALADIIRHADANGHIVGNHHLNDALFRAWKPGSALRHYSMQFRATGDEAHTAALNALRRAGNRYQVIYSESTATPADVDGMRRHAWAISMAGMMPMLLPLDFGHMPTAALAQCRALQRFFEGTDFYRMSSQDELRDGDTRYVLADMGRSYIVYGDKIDGGLGVKDLPAGDCHVTWLDCASGRTLLRMLPAQPAGARAFSRPPGFGSECAAWIQFPAIVPALRGAKRANATIAARPEANRAPVARSAQVTGRADETYIQLEVDDADGPGPYTYSVLRPPQHGKLSGNNNDLYYRPNPGFAGTDEFAWKVNDGVADSAPATVRITIQAPHRPKAK